MKLTWTVYPIGWDSLEERYSGDAVSMGDRFHFGSLEFDSHAEALESGSQALDAFILCAELPEDVVDSLKADRSLAETFMEHNGIVLESFASIWEYLELDELEYSQTVFV